MPTLCPIAIVASCQQCPAFRACPLKTVLGDHVEEEPAAAESAPEEEAAETERS